VVLLLSGLTLLVSLGQAAQVLVSWMAPTTNADGTPLQDLGGYLLHYGTASGLYSTYVDTGLVPSATLSGLTAGQTYYFAATVYDTSGNESAYSQERPYTIPASDTTLPTVAITAPLNGASVARKSTVTITVTASDNGGVARAVGHCDSRHSTAVAGTG
jgi:Bacterial Ig domain